MESPRLAGCGTPRRVTRRLAEPSAPPTPAPLHLAQPTRQHYHGIPISDGCIALALRPPATEAGREPPAGRGPPGIRGPRAPRIAQRRRADRRPEQHPDHPIAHDVVVEAVTQALPNIETATVQMVQVVDLAANNQVLASAPLGSVSGISITSGTGDTGLTVETGTFGSPKVPAITFAGGNGNNTLSVTGSNTTDWNITGNDAGNVAGSAPITFTGVTTCRAARKTPMSSQSPRAVR